jgi:hypothetical protein
MILAGLFQWGRWIGGTYPSAIFFGEYEFPKEEDYQD